MRDSHFFRVVVILIATPLIAAPAVRAQRGHATSAPGMAAHLTSTAPLWSPLRTGHRNSLGFDNGFGDNSLACRNISFFPNTNYGLGINGINSVTTQDIGTLAAIDPATQWRLALATRVARSLPGGFGGGGYYLLDGGGAYALPAEPAETEPAPQQQQPIVVVQQPSASQAPPLAEQVPPAPPLPDAGQFTLVMRDGAQVEAVAFTRGNDQIIYITREGTRRTIPLSNLDIDATVRINQERGTPLQLPL